MRTFNHAKPRFMEGALNKQSFTNHCEGDTGEGKLTMISTRMNAQVRIKKANVICEVQIGEYIKMNSIANIDRNMFMTLDVLYEK